MQFIVDCFIRTADSVMVTPYSISSHFMRLFRLVPFLRLPLLRSWRTRHWVCGIWFSLLAALTLLSAPAHGLMGWQNARAVTLCTAQGMMTVWVDNEHSLTTDAFTDLKLKASQQCLSCLVHLPNVAPPTHSTWVHLVQRQHLTAAAPIFVDIATPHWRWASPRAPPTLSA